MSNINCHSSVDSLVAVGIAVISGVFIGDEEETDTKKKLIPAGSAIHFILSLFYGCGFGVFGNVIGTPHWKESQLRFMS